MATTKKRPVKKSTKAKKAAPAKAAPATPQQLVTAPAPAPVPSPAPVGSVKEPIQINPEQVKIINGMREKVMTLKMQAGEMAVQRAQFDAQSDQLKGQIGQVTGTIAQTDQELRETLFGYLREAGVDPEREQWTFQFQTNSFVRVRTV